MTVAPALRKIEAELRTTLANPDGIDAEVVAIAARQIAAQAEMVELEIDKSEAGQ